ncbi:MAG: cob(I)yrinic acid a,c-diamide adenosyltransferase [Bdellovibrionota bacterium]
MSIRINRVYTRSGDDGTTGLVGGTRVKKTDLRVAAYGDVDELNSALGVAKEELDSATTELRPFLEYIQQELFDLGSELATAAGSEYEGMWKAEARHVETLERLCDRFSEGLPELDSFILPGGSRLAAALHVARTVARRAERSVLALQEIEPTLNRQVICYLNRLSDLLFILARSSLAKQGLKAPLWVQAKHRKLPEL